MSGIRKRWWDTDEEIEDDGTRWWHNLPQCKVGDLVQYSSQLGRLKDPMIVIKVSPKKPCRVNPVQYVTVLKCSNGRTSTFEAKTLEVISCAK